MQGKSNYPVVAIVCGGTGGHLFPGLAIGEALQLAGCDVTLFITAKVVDQLASQSASGMRLVTLPAVSVAAKGLFAFIKGYRESYKLARKTLMEQEAKALVAMGGFISAPPVWAARKLGLPCFLHEANSIPGRANRLLVHWVQEAFTYFPQAAKLLSHNRVSVVGMPVRSQFQPMDPAACRAMLGLDPARPVLLVMGGSQGALSVNNLVLDTAPLLMQKNPDLQILHLTGPQQETKAAEIYRKLGCKAVVKPFLTEMELAMNAATVAISRAGASSVAEIAALQLPSILIPYPSAANNHQYFNALALVETGAARMVLQKVATPSILSEMVLELVQNQRLGDTMRMALKQWHYASAAETVARKIIDSIPGFSAEKSGPAKHEESDSGAR